MKMMRNLKKVYERPIAEIVPMYTQRLMSSVSTWNADQGNGDEPIVVIGDQDPNLGKECGFDNECDYEEKFNFGWE